MKRWHQCFYCRKKNACTQSCSWIQHHTGNRWYSVCHLLVYCQIWFCLQQSGNCFCQVRRSRTATLPKKHCTQLCVLKMYMHLWFFFKYIHETEVKKGKICVALMSIKSSFHLICCCHCADLDCKSNHRYRQTAVFTQFYLNCIITTCQENI